MTVLTAAGQTALIVDVFLQQADQLAVLRPAFIRVPMLRQAADIHILIGLAGLTVLTAAGQTALIVDVFLQQADQLAVLRPAFIRVPMLRQAADIHILTGLAGLTVLTAVGQAALIMDMLHQAADQFTVLRPAPIRVPMLHQAAGVRSYFAGSLHRVLRVGGVVGVQARLRVRVLRHRAAQLPAGEVAVRRMEVLYQAAEIGIRVRSQVQIAGVVVDVGLLAAGADHDLPVLALRLPQARLAMLVLNDHRQLAGQHLAGLDAAHAVIHLNGLIALRAVGVELVLLLAADLDPGDLVALLGMDMDLRDLLRHLHGLRVLRLRAGQHPLPGVALVGVDMPLALLQAAGQHMADFRLKAGLAVGVALLMDDAILIHHGIDDLALLIGAGLDRVSRRLRDIAGVGVMMALRLLQWADQLAALEAVAGVGVDMGLRGGARRGVCGGLLGFPGGLPADQLDLLLEAALIVDMLHPLLQRADQPALAVIAQLVVGVEDHVGLLPLLTDQLRLRRDSLQCPAALVVDMGLHPADRIVRHGDRGQNQSVSRAEHNNSAQAAQYPVADPSALV